MIRAAKALFGSESRFRLLRELYARPKDEFQLRSLAAIANVDPGQAHKLIRSFVTAGLCEQASPGPFARYRASQNEQLQAALRALFAAIGKRPRTDPMQLVEDRSLRLHEAAMKQLLRDPQLLERAKQTLHRWISKHGSDVPIALLEWEKILNKPISEIGEVVLQRTQYGDRIRKSSPLVTLVPTDERRRAYAP